MAVVLAEVVVSRGRLMGRRVQRALLTLAVCFLLGRVVFRECWAGLSVLLGKLQGDDAMEQRAVERRWWWRNNYSKGRRWWWWWEQW